MKNNIGKIFESNWRKSVPDNIFYYRPPDSAQSFELKTQKLRFSAKSPCDCFMFDGTRFYTLEMKSVGTKSISFERDKDDRGVIHKHQIENLKKYSAYINIVSGFIFDFRLSDKTYYCNINEFEEMINHIDKKSFNEKDLFDWCSPVVINKKKLKVNYRYDINDFLEKAY